MISADKKDQHLIEEAHKILNEASRRGIILRLMGAIAIRAHCEKYGRLLSDKDAFNRHITDIDFASYSKYKKDVRNLFYDLGYTLDKELLISEWGNKFAFHDVTSKIHVDVFFDKLIMSHTIDFKNRLELNDRTLTPADLLLEKLQIQAINEKDIKDTIVLLLEHPLGNRDDDEINVGYICDLLSVDWGFYYTFTTNLSKVDSYLSQYSFLDSAYRAEVKEKIKSLLENVAKKEKSLRWKIRSKIGTKVRWYREVEERTRGKLGV